MEKNKLSRVFYAGLVLVIIFFFTSCASFQPNPKYQRNRPEKTRKARSSDVPATPQEEDLLDMTVRLWWGTPYEWGGEHLGSGVDCSAYTQAVVQSVYGINLPRTSKEQYKTGYPVNRSQLKRGDLIFFKQAGKGINHVGIYLENGRFTHASKSDGVTIDRMDHPYYKKRYAGARRIR